MAPRDRRGDGWRAASEAGRRFARHEKNRSIASGRDRSRRVDAEDIAQEAWLVYLKKHPGLEQAPDTRGRVGAWLRGTIRHLLQQQGRRQNRRIRDVPAALSGPVGRSVAVLPSLDPPAVVTEAADSEIQALTPDLRLAATLLRDGYAWENLALCLGVAVPVVIARAFRAARWLHFARFGRPLRPAPSRAVLDELSKSERVLRLHDAGFSDLEMASLLGRDLEALGKLRWRRKRLAWPPDAVLPAGFRIADVPRARGKGDK